MARAGAGAGGPDALLRQLYALWRSKGALGAAADRLARLLIVLACFSALAVGVILNWRAIGSCAAAGKACPHSLPGFLPLPLTTLSTRRRTLLAAIGVIAAVYACVRLVGLLRHAVRDAALAAWLRRLRVPPLADVPWSTVVKAVDHALRTRTRTRTRTRSGSHAATEPDRYHRALDALVEAHRLRAQVVPEQRLRAALAPAAAAAAAAAAAPPRPVTTTTSAAARSGFAFLPATTTTAIEVAELNEAAGLEMQPMKAAETAAEEGKEEEEEEEEEEQEQAAAVVEAPPPDTSSDTALFLAPPHAILSVHEANVRITRQDTFLVALLASGAVNMVMVLPRLSRLLLCCRGCCGCCGRGGRTADVRYARLPTVRADAHLDAGDGVSEVHTLSEGSLSPDGSDAGSISGSISGSGGGSGGEATDDDADVGRLHLPFTSSTVWVLQYVVLKPLFTPDGWLKASEMGVRGARKLRWRLRAIGLAGLLLSPLTALLIAVMYAVRQAEDVFTDRDYVGPRQWSPWAKWGCRDFAELEHSVQTRLAAARPAAVAYLNQFSGSVVISSAARVLAFVSGLALCFLFFFAAIDEQLLLRSNLLTASLALSVLLAVARAGAGHAHPRAGDQEAALRALADRLHYMPQRWRAEGQACNRAVAAEVDSLLPYRWRAGIAEMTAAVTTPLWCLLLLPARAERILAYVADNSITREGLGTLCVWSCKWRPEAEAAAAASTATAAGGAGGGTAQAQSQPQSQPRGAACEQDNPYLRPDAAAVQLSEDLKYKMTRSVQGFLAEYSAA